MRIRRDHEAADHPRASTPGTDADADADAHAGADPDPDPDTQADTQADADTGADADADADPATDAHAPAGPDANAAAGHRPAEPPDSDVAAAVADAGAFGNAGEFAERGAVCTTELRSLRHPTTGADARPERRRSR